MLEMGYVVVAPYEVYRRDRLIGCHGVTRCSSSLGANKAEGTAHSFQVGSVGVCIAFKSRLGPGWEDEIGVKVTAKVRSSRLPTVWWIPSPSSRSNLPQLVMRNCWYMKGPLLPMAVKACQSFVTGWLLLRVAVDGHILPYCTLHPPHENCLGACSNTNSASPSKLLCIMMCLRF